MPITLPETLPAYDMSLADHGFEPIEIKGLTYPLGEHVPGYGEIYPLASDMGWTRMPVPGNLNHINIWLLDDRDEEGDGFAIADTGLFMPPVIEEWKGLLEGALGHRRALRRRRPRPRAVPVAAHRHRHRRQRQEQGEPGTVENGRAVALKHALVPHAGTGDGAR